MLLKCYMLTICRGSVADCDTNNFTLFELTENLAIPPELFGQAIALEVLSFWHIGSDAADTDFEVRAVRVFEDGDEDPGDIMPMNPGKHQRMRLRARGLKIPKAYGDYKLFPEWRKKGDEEWTRDNFYWPLRVVEPPPPPVAPEK